MILVTMPGKRGVRLFSVAICALGVLCGVGVYLMLSGQNSAAPSIPQLVGLRQPVKSTVESAAQQEPPTPSEVSGERHLSMATALAAAEDLRAFAEMAKQRPELGGYFYEQVAVERCREVRQIQKEYSALPSTSAVEHPKVLARDAALAHLTRQCASFIDSELDLYRFHSPVDQQAVADGKDPLLKLKTDVLQAYGSADVAAMARSNKAILATQDMEFIQKSGLGITKDGYYFDGHVLSGAKGAQAFSAALSLAACELGERCGSEDFIVLKNCATDAICTSSRQETIEAVLRDDQGFTESDVSRVKALSRSLASALQAQDVDKFVPGAK